MPASSRATSRLDSVHAENQLGSGLHRGTNLRRVEAVDADPHSGLAQLAYDRAQVGEGNSRGAADVDEIRAAGAEVIGGGTDLRPAQLGRVVDLGQDLDRVGAVVRCGGRLPEVAGDLPQVLGSLLDSSRRTAPVSTPVSPSQRPGISTRSVSGGTSRKRAIHGVVISAATVIFMTATSGSNGGCHLLQHPAQAPVRRACR